MLPSQMQAVNPILILIFIPLFSYVIYPLLGSLFEVTPLRKMASACFSRPRRLPSSRWPSSASTPGTRRISPGSSSPIS